MSYHPDIHRRRSIRLPDYDYTRAGAYFVTICTYQRECLFGDIVDGVMRLNECGMVVQQPWDDLPNHFRHVVLDQFVIMPNHVHGIIVLTDDSPVISVGAGFKPALNLNANDLSNEPCARAGLKPAPTSPCDFLRATSTREAQFNCSPSERNNKNPLDL